MNQRHKTYNKETKPTQTTKKQTASSLQVPVFKAPKSTSNMGQFIRDPRQIVEILVVVQGDIRLAHDGLQEVMHLLGPAIEGAGVQDIIIQEIPADNMQYGQLHIEEQQEPDLHDGPDGEYRDGGEEIEDRQEMQPGQPRQQQVPRPGQPRQRGPRARQPPRRPTDRCQRGARLHREGTEEVMRTCGLPRVTRSRARQ